MFIPDANSSLIVNSGLLKCTSYKAETIAIAVSIILPINPISIIALDSLSMLIPVL